MDDSVHSSTDDLVPRDHENEGNCFTNQIRQNRCVQVSVYMIAVCWPSDYMYNIQFKMARAKARNGKYNHFIQNKEKRIFRSILIVLYVLKSLVPL
jgi:hypothetical protein